VLATATLSTAAEQSHPEVLNGAGLMAFVDDNKNLVWRRRVIARLPVNTLAISSC
jgi:hypothetical protein